MLVNAGPTFCVFFMCVKVVAIPILLASLMHKILIVLTSPKCCISPLGCWPFFNSGASYILNSCNF